MLLIALIRKFVDIKIASIMSPWVLNIQQLNAVPANYRHNFVYVFEFIGRKEGTCFI